MPRARRRRDCRPIATSRARPTASPGSWARPDWRSSTPAPTPGGGASPRLPAERDFERSPHGLAGILGEAGLAVTHAGTHAWRWRVAPDDLWEGLTSVGNFGVLWREQTADVQARLRTAYDALGAPWRDGTDLVFDVECVVAEARVPRS